MADKEIVRHVEGIKRRLGLDERLGRSLSDLSEEHGRRNRVSEISPSEGTEISRRHFNPAVAAVLDRLAEEMR